MRISEYSIRHPAVVGILLAALFVAAAAALSGLKQQLFAETEMPQATIITLYPGGAPEDVEREVTNPLEDVLSTLDGVTEMTSTSSQWSSIIRISFTMQTDPASRIVDIRELINNAMPLLPDDISGLPQIHVFSTAALSAYTAVVESLLPPEQVTAYLKDQVIPRLSKISGAASVSVNGAVDREVRIVLDPDKMPARGLSALEIAQVLSSGNLSLPAGSTDIRGENMNIRTNGRFSRLEDMAGLVIGYQEGTPIRLRDVTASLSIGPVDSPVIPITRGKEVITVSVDLTKDADTTVALSRVKYVLAQIEREQAGGIRFSTLNDDSEIIRLSLTSVLNSAVTGGLLAILVLFLFLHNFRTTSIISVSIPLSLMIALMSMQLRGMTVNMMTLVGLTIAIGMIVDASIVMLEHIHRIYLLREEHGRKEASIRGAREMSGAITASTLTSLAVFVPLLFLKGIIGEILRDISLTMAFALTGSLLVALTVIPFLTAHTLKAAPPPGTRPPRLDIVFGFMEKAVKRLEKKYNALLERSLDNRAFVLTLAITLLIMSFMVTRFLGFDFIPATDMNELNIAITTPQGYSLEETAAKARAVESEVLSLVPEVETAVFYAGQKGFFNLGGSTPDRCFAIVRLQRVVDRKRGIFEIISQLQNELPRRIPDIDVTVKNGGFSKLLDASVGGSGFIINLRGTDFHDVLLSADMVEKIMMLDPNIVKVDRNISSDRRNLQILLDHQLMGVLGVSTVQAVRTNRIMFNGIETGSYRGAESGSSEIPITLTSRYRDSRIDENVLNRIWIRSAAGHLVSMQSFSSLSRENTVSAIEHRDGMVSISLAGQLREYNLRETQARVTELLGKADFPSGVDWEVGGSAAEMANAFSDLILVLMISVFLVYMVMVIQFERFIQPLIVMACVPFTLVGVVISLLIFGSTLNIVSMLGIIALSGIVVNNAIVLIDYINLLRSEGAELRNAVLTGASSRLKPILMTTMTTVLGIFPIALGLGEGGDILDSLGQAIAGGLITSTLITLVLIPVLYLIIEEKREK